MKVDFIEAPAYWAPALINADFSGYDPVEAAEIKEWASRKGWPVEVGPAFIGRWNGQLCELAEYILLHPE